MPECQLPRTLAPDAGAATVRLRPRNDRTEVVRLSRYVREPGERRCAHEDSVRHRSGQLAGERVLLARVERAEHRDAVRGDRLETVAEAGTRPDPEQPGDHVVGELTEGDDHTDRADEREL